MRYRLKALPLKFVIYCKKLNKIFKRVKLNSMCINMTNNNKILKLNQLILLIKIKA